MNLDYIYIYICEYRLYEIRRATIWENREDNQMGDKETEEGREDEYGQSTWCNTMQICLCNKIYHLKVNTL